MVFILKYLITSRLFLKFKKNKPCSVSRIWSLLSLTSRLFILLRVSFICNLCIIQTLVPLPTDYVVDSHDLILYPFYTGTVNYFVSHHFMDLKTKFCLFHIQKFYFLSFLPVCASSANCTLNVNIGAVWIEWITLSFFFRLKLFQGRGFQFFSLLFHS